MPCRGLPAAAMRQQLSQACVHWILRSPAATLPDVLVSIVVQLQVFEFANVFLTVLSPSLECTPGIRHGVLGSMIHSYSIHVFLMK